MQLNTTNHMQMLYLALCIFFSACGVVHAQNSQSNDVYIETELSRSSVYVGDEVSYSITVYNARNPEQPSVEFPPNILSIYHGRSSQSFTTMRNENGRRRTVTQRSHVFQYTLTALEEGAVYIPAPTVVDGGVSFDGNESSFNSLLPTESQNDLLEISIDRTTLYLNESIEVQCSWWLNNHTSEFNFASSLIPDSFVIRSVDLPRNTAQIIEFPLNNQTVKGHVSDAMRNGQEFRRFSFRFSITPTQIGKFELGPIRSIFTRQSGTGSRFRAYVESDTIPIEVIPVPIHGKPANYDGAIGSYSLETRASNQRVHVGDPIELMLRVQGQEPMTGVQNAPPLNDLPAFTTGFKVDSSGWREDLPRRDGTRIYRTTIRALSDAVDQIPSIEIPSFNPQLGTYRVYTSKPIPLEVTAVNEVTLADAIVSGNDQSQLAPQRREVERIELTTAAPGLWAHSSVAEQDSNRHFDVIQTLQTPAWIAGISAPPATFLAFLLVARYRQNRNMDLVKATQALRASKKAKGVEALRVYVSRVLDIDLDAFTAADTSQLSSPPDVQDQAHAYLLSAETSSGEQPGFAECRNLIKQIHFDHVASIREGVS
jgi:hypothetical protein